MAIEEILFWFFAVAAVAGGLGVVLHPNPIKSALFLVMTFFALAGEYILLMGHFVAIVHIAVYAGAIMVLFLFVIMLLNVPEETRQGGVWGVMRYVALGLFVFLSFQLSYFGFQDFFGDKQQLVKETDVGTVESIGMSLFSEYVLPFEIASVLLITAMVGAIYLSKSKLIIEESKKKKTVEKEQH